MKESRTKNRYYSAILYNEDVNFKKYKKNIEDKFYEVTYIKHDKDIEETGEIKKEHYHFLFKVGENARTLKSVAKEIDIPENYLQGCNKKAMLQYLIHLNNPEKTQYNIEEVKGQLKEELEEIIESKRSEEEKLEPIIYYIHNRHIKNLYQLMYYGIQKKQANLIRKYQYILTKLIEREEKKRIVTTKKRKGEIKMIRKYNEDIEEELEQIKERVIEEVKYMLQTEELEAYKLKTIAEIYDILS